MNQENIDNLPRVLFILKNDEIVYKFDNISNPEDVGKLYGSILNPDCIKMICEDIMMRYSDQEKERVNTAFKEISGAIDGFDDRIIKPSEMVFGEISSI